MKKDNINRLPQTFLFLILFMFPVFLYGQKQPGIYLIRGQVTTHTGTPLPGVTILLDSTSIGVTSDQNGQFALNLPKAQGTLVFSFIGYETQRVHFNASQPLTVRLKEKAAQLDEVTVRAYGSQKTRNITGAVVTLKKETFEGLPNASLENSVQGKIAGVQVLQLSGAPGNSNLSMQIRGYSNLVDNTRPLYVIDGVTVTSDQYVFNGINPLSEINPEDIETFTVLKDAGASSIYGSRAANGVVIITTKQGKFNQKKRIKASFSETWTLKPKLPKPDSRERQFRMEALNNYEESFWDSDLGCYRYPESYDDALAHNAAYGFFYGKGYGAQLPYYQDSLSYDNYTNVFNYFFQPARTLNANIQVSGGASDMAYHFSLGYFDEKGTFRNTGFNRINLTSNLTYRLLENLSGNLRLYGAYSTQKRTSEDQDAFFFGTTDNITKIPRPLFGYSVVLPGPGTEMFEAFKRTVEETNSKNYSARFRGNIDLSYHPIDALTLKILGAVDFNLHNAHVFKPSTQTSDKRSYTSEDIVQKLLCLFEATADYKFSLGEHNFDILAGYSLQRDVKKDVNMYAKDAATNAMRYAPWTGNVMNLLTNEIYKDATSGFEKAYLLGYIGRLDYNFREKWLASVTVRRDASSKFGEKVRWGTFPSVSIGYVLSDEPWMEATKPIVDFFKIRGSYGKSGRPFDDPNIAYGSLMTSDPFLGNPTIIPNYIDGLLNKKLSWEETNQYNIGLDITLFNRRLNIKADYYYKYTDRLLWLVKLPGNFGNVNQWRNAYALSNEGIEFEFKAGIIRKPAFNWNLSMNIAKNWNMLRKSYDGYDFANTDPVYGNNLSIIGKPLNQLYVFKDQGIYQDAAQIPYTYVNGRKFPLWGAGNQYYRPGDRILTDADYNGRIETNPGYADDRICAGDPNPSISGGITNIFSYKGFTLEILLIGSAGRTILNATEESLATYTGSSVSDIVRPVLVSLDDKHFWTRPGDNANYPRNTAEAGLNNFATNIMSNIQKVNFLKVKNIRLSYSLPQTLIQKLNFGATLYIGLQNLATWTNYKGLDPESVSNVIGVDNSDNYPLTRMVSLGVQLNF